MPSKSLRITHAGWQRTWKCTFTRSRTLILNLASHPLSCCPSNVPHLPLFLIHELTFLFYYEQLGLLPKSPAKTHLLSHLLPNIHLFLPNSNLYPLPLLHPILQHIPYLPNLQP